MHASLIAKYNNYHWNAYEGRLQNDGHFIETSKFWMHKSYERLPWHILTIIPYTS